MTKRLLAIEALAVIGLSAQCTRFIYNPFTQAQDCVSTGAAGPTIGGSGTTNYLSMFTAAGTIGNSGLLNNGGILYPPANGTAAVQINKADGTTNVATVDTTNARLGIETTAPIGKLQAVISATAPVIFGGATVGSYTAVTSPTANKDYLVKTGLATAATVGDLIVLTAGTGATTGSYIVIAEPGGADTVQVDRNIHASGSDVTDIAISMSTAPAFVAGTSRIILGVGGSANMVVCYKADGKTLGYATVAEITAGTCN